MTSFEALAIILLESIEAFMLYVIIRKIEGGLPSKVIPLLNDLMVARVGRLKNLGGAEPVKDVPDELMTAFYKKLYELHNSPDEYKMTETFWYPELWQSIGGSSIVQMRKAFERAELVDKVLCRKTSADNSPRVLASYARLRKRMI